MRPGRVIPAAALAVAVVVLTAASAHPLHTTLTEVTRRGPVTRVRVRAFADDAYRAIVRREPPAGAAVPPIPDSAAAGYLRRRVTLATPAGAALPLAWCGQERRDDVVFLCLEAAWSGPLAGARVGNAMHTELYPDQVNVVQAAWDGGRASLLFVAGDGPKVLR